MSLLKKISLFCSVALVATTSLFAAEKLPPVVERYEQILLRSPAKGVAFDKVYQYFSEGAGVEKLMARWEEKATVKSGSAASYTLLLGLLDDRRGKGTEALAKYKKATELNPAESRAWLALADAEAAIGKFPLAVEAYQGALKNQPPKELRPQIYREMARCQQRAFDGEGAIRTWKLLLNESPGDPIVMDEVADAMADAERYDEAQAIYEKIQKAAGASAYQQVTALLQIARLEEKQNKRESAMSRYESALLLAADGSWINREVRARIEESYRRQDDIPGLVAYYQKWLATRGKDVETAVRLSDALIELNKNDESVEQLKNAVAWAPDRADLQSALAKRLQSVGKLSEAVTTLEMLVKTHPEDGSYKQALGEAHWEIFKAHGSESEKQAAIACWRQLVPEETTDAGRVGVVAELFKAHLLSAEALEYFAKAVSISPDVPEHRERWADYLFEQKQDADAWKALAAMTEGARATPDNFLRLARIQNRRQDVTSALDSVLAGLVKAPDHFELLALEWQLLAGQERWAEAAALYDALLAAAPSLYSSEQVEERQVQALRALDRLETEKTRLAVMLNGTHPPTETESRLFLRILLQLGDLDAAQAPFDAVEKLYPDSPSVVRLRVAYEKRRQSLEGVVAGLRRLIVLLPKQKTETLVEITRNYQEEGEWAKAAASAAEAIEASPASAECRVLAADVEFGAGHFETGADWLRQAIKLSDKPNELRQRLARTYLDAGQAEQAKQVYDEAFEAEDSPRARLSLTRQLAATYIQLGKLDELIARFRERQRAEEGGWRYALYLSEIFQQMQDYGAAREELSKALGAKSRDPDFLGQLIKLSQAEQNTAEVSKYSKLLAEVEPSAARRKELAAALIANGDVEGALKLIEEHRDELMENLGGYTEVLRGIAQTDSGGKAVEMLKTAVAARPDSWEIRMALAEIEIGAGDLESARQLLQEICDMKPSPSVALAAPVVQAPTPTMASAVRRGSGRYYPGGGYGGYSPSGAGASKFDDLEVKSQRGISSFAQLVNAGKSSRRGSGRSFGFGYGYMNPGGGMQMPPVSTLQDGKDKAFVYLVLIADRLGSTNAFLASLDERLKGAPRGERLTAYLLAGVQEEIKAEIKEEALHPSGDVDLNRYCLARSMRSNNYFPGAVTQLPDADFVAVFLAREKDPDTILMSRMSYSGVLLQANRTDEAAAMVTQVLAGAATAEGDKLGMMFGFAMQMERLDTAEQILTRMLSEADKAGLSPQQLGGMEQAAATLASGFLKEAATADRGIWWLGESLRRSYPPQLPNAQPVPFGRSPWGGGIVSFNGRTSYSQSGVSGPFPSPGGYLDETQITSWNLCYQALVAADALDRMTEEFYRQLQTLPEDQTVYVELARACFEWWADSKPNAIKDVLRLAKEMKDDDLLLMGAGMLAEVGEPDAAREVVEHISATTGPMATEKQMRILLLSKELKDKERMKAASDILLAQPIDQNVQYQIRQALEEAGLKEESKNVTKKARTKSPPRGNRPARMEDQMSQYVMAKQMPEAAALARTILSRDPLGGAQQQDYGRRSAVQVLRTAGLLDEYQQNLEKQLAEAPASLRTLYCLAEVYDDKQSEKALECYRKLAELKKGDPVFLVTLAQRLGQAKQFEEAMQCWEAALAADPDGIVQQGQLGQALETFRAAKQVPRFGKLLVGLVKTTKGKLGGTTMSPEVMEQLAEPANQLSQDGDLEDAIVLWRAVLDAPQQYGQTNQVLLSVIDALAASGDLAGAEEVLMKYFFRKPVVKKTISMSLLQQQHMVLWMQPEQIVGQRFSIAGASVLPAAKRLNLLDKLRARAVVPGEIQDEREKDLFLLFIDAARRDPSMEGEFKARLAKVTEGSVKKQVPLAPGALFRTSYDVSSVMPTSFLFSIAEELSDWKEGHSMAVEVLKAIRASDGIDAVYSDGGPPWAVADLAAKLGEMDVAKQEIREYLQMMKNPKQAKPGRVRMNTYSGRNPLDVASVEKMADWGMTEEVLEAVKVLAKDPNIKGSPGALAQLKEIANRVSISTGEGGELRLVSWTEPPSAVSEKTVICWDIGPAQSGSEQRSSDSQITVADVSSEGVKGRYSIKIFAGSDDGGMEEIGSLPNAEARGRWVYDKALPGSTIQLVARSADDVLFGNATRSHMSPNLLPNPTLSMVSAPGGGAAQKLFPDGWKGVPVSFISQREGGPNAASPRICITVGNRGNRSPLISDPVPLEKGKSYLFSAWVRYARQYGSIQISAKLRTAKGEDREQNSISPQNFGRGWTLLTMRFNAGSNYENNARPIRDAEEITFQLNLQDITELQGLYFGEVTEP